jgi:hypothetical protein
LQKCLAKNMAFSTDNRFRPLILSNTTGIQYRTFVTAFISGTGLWYRPAFKGAFKKFILAADNTFLKHI